MASSMAAAGMRTYLVTVQAKTDAETASGFPGESWADLGAAEYMSRETALTWDGQGEQFRAGQLSARSYDIWKGNYRSDLDPELVDIPGTRRLVFQSRIFDVIQAYLIGRAQIVFVTLASTKVLA